MKSDDDDSTNSYDDGGTESDDYSSHDAYYAYNRVRRRRICYM